MTKELLRQPWIKYAAILVSAILILAVVGFWLTMLAEASYKDKIYPGVMVGDIALKNKTKAEAKELLNTRTKILNEGTKFIYQDKQVVVSPNSVSFDGDLAYQLFTINIDRTVDQAYQMGRDRSVVVNWQHRLNCWLNSCSVPLAIDYNQPKIVELLKKEFSDLESPAEDAELKIGASDNWEITKEKFGHKFDYGALTSLFLNNLAQAKNQNINLIMEEEAPHIFQAEVGDVTPQIDAWLALAPLTLKFTSTSTNNLTTDKTWTVQKAGLRSWLGLQADYQSGQKQIKVVVKPELLDKYFAQSIGPEINQKPLEAKFEVKNGGRVALFQEAQDGQEIDIDSTVAELNRALENNRHEIFLAVKVTPADNTQNLDTMGIDEIIGTGTSTFAGSPANRRHNIAVGAKAINGLLIKPGEEFSLVKALGKIDASTGYLTELVIKENKTIPEYGGGLCQIGTTLFRTVLNSGLPITERQNHSYRVVYYEPAGTDATIYDPQPDFRFINDTKNYILIQTKIEGNQATFNFWGHRDGRTVAPIKPTIYNITKPAPPKMVETLDLPVGQQKCTESAHNGADAFFDYKVTYADGTEKDKRFTSHYVPWQKVCLVGVDKLSDPNAPTDGQIPPLVNPDAAGIIAPTSTAQ